MAEWEESLQGSNYRDNAVIGNVFCYVAVSLEDGSLVNYVDDHIGETVFNRKGAVAFGYLFKGANLVRIIDSYIDDYYYLSDNPCSCKLLLGELRNAHTNFFNANLKREHPNGSFLLDIYNGNASYKEYSAPILAKYCIDSGEHETVSQPAASSCVVPVRNGLELAFDGSGLEVRLESSGCVLTKRVTPRGAYVVERMVDGRRSPASKDEAKAYETRFLEWSASNLEGGFLAWVFDGKVSVDLCHTVFTKAEPRLRYEIVTEFEQRPKQGQSL